jgi:hypothetical protein
LVVWKSPGEGRAWRVDTRTIAILAFVIAVIVLVIIVT